MSAAHNRFQGAPIRQAIGLWEEGRNLAGTVEEVRLYDQAVVENR